MLGASTLRVDIDNIASVSIISQGESKKCDIKKHGHNYSEIHQKGKKLVCFGNFSLNAAG